MKCMRSTALALLILLVPAPLLALETDVLFGSGNVKPNVLILFDNSGSMNNAPKYDPADTYAGTYNATTKYTRCKVFNSNCTCRTTQTAWIVLTNSCGFVDTSPVDGVDDRTSFTKIGNRLNYDFNIGAKIDLAKTVITSMLQDPANANMRFGLMIYNGNWDLNAHSFSDPTNFTNYHNDTSVLKSACQDTNQTNLINLINNTSAFGGTPSANRLEQAGNYFAGTFPGFVTPVQYSCQRNYIIDITDGIPEGEGNSLTSNLSGQYTDIENWLHAKLGSNIDPDGDNNEPDPTANPTNCQSCGRFINGGSDYLDDVAWVLQHQDLFPAMAGQQNITTFTIGFDINHQLLADTATNAAGRYFPSNDADSLADAIRKTLNLIATDAQSFVAPVVPVNALKRTQSGDKLYIALFQPAALSTFWAGNIKKYGISTGGDIVNPDGSSTTGSDGTILSTAKSFFDSGAPSGNSVTRGGVGQVLLDRSSSRKIYTYLGNTDLTVASNAFAIGNTAITTATLGVSTATDRTDLINFMYGSDSYDDDNDDNMTEKRDWILGDFIHSTPQVVTYSSTDHVVIAGANDGMLHVFDDATGDELWAFMPPSLLGRLKELIPGGATAHPFLVDGSAKAMKTDTGQIILIFGLRRGGSDYYALDITNKTSPKFLWTLNSSTGGFSELGQAWSEPVLGTLGTPTTFVAIFGGGYDNWFDDSTHSGTNTGTPKGRALYIVNAKTGALIQSITGSGLTYPIPSDISALDANADGTIDIAYVGDLGGNLWRWELPNTLTKIFSTPSGQKIFSSPDLVLQNGYIGIYFGTGDYASPLSTGVTDRLYAFRDDGLTGGYTETNLVDVTDNLAQDGTAAQKTAISNALATSRGWYVRLTQAGEKALASPLVFFDVFFTTFFPNSSVCSGGGDSLLYTLAFENGGATVDSNSSGSLSLADRAKNIGSSIPTEVTLTIRDQTAVGYVGVGGAIPKVNLPSPPLNVVPMSWRELY